MEDSTQLNDNFINMLATATDKLNAIIRRMDAPKTTIRASDTMQDFIAITYDRIGDLEGMIEEERERVWPDENKIAEWRLEMSKRRSTLARLEAKRATSA